MSKQWDWLWSNTPLLWALINSVAVPLAGFVQYYVWGIIFLFTLDASVYGSVREAGIFWGGLAYSSLGGAVAGVLLALAQALALLRTPVSKWRWIAGTVAALAVSSGMIFAGFWLLSAYAGSVSIGLAYTLAGSDPWRVLYYCAIMLIPAIVQSIMLGAWQWWAFKNSFYGYGDKRWIGVTAAGWAAWFLLPILGLSLINRVLPDEAITAAIIFVVASVPYVALTTRALRQILKDNLPFYAREGYQT